MSGTSSSTPVPGPDSQRHERIATATRRGRRRLLERASQALGEPVTAAAAFRVEGSLPWYVGGVAVGVGLASVVQLGALVAALGGAVGVVAGAALARIVTRNRAPGCGFTTVLACTRTQLHAIKANFWSGKPTREHIGEWGLTNVTAHVRQKQFTTAVILDLGNALQARLESTSRRAAQELIAHLPSSTTADDAPPGWRADPSGAHELRYWTGAVWTEHFANRVLKNRC